MKRTVLQGKIILIFCAVVIVLNLQGCSGTIGTVKRYIEFNPMESNLINKDNSVKNNIFLKDFKYDVTSNYATYTGVGMDESQPIEMIQKRFAEWLVSKNLNITSSDESNYELIGSITVHQQVEYNNLKHIFIFLPFIDDYYTADGDMKLMDSISKKIVFQKKFNKVKEINHGPVFGAQYSSSILSITLCQTADELMAQMSDELANIILKQ